MTHETLLVLLCTQLWPGFTEQLTVNWWFSSPDHLIVSVTSRLWNLVSAVCVEMLYKSPVVLFPLPVQHSNSSHHIFNLYRRKWKTRVPPANEVMRKWQADLQRPQPQQWHADWRSCRSRVWSSPDREQCSGLTAGAPSSAPAQAAR